jgi:nucleotide-binding universal stress UspA family protein
MLPTTFPSSIVVPADGSPAAEAAAWYAGAVAEGRGATTHVVAAWEPPGSRAQELSRTLGRRTEVDRVLAGIEGALGAAGLQVRGHVRRCGLVAALCAVASEHDAELIVVPAGWGSLARELRWRAGCRVDMLVLDAEEHAGFRPFPIAAEPRIGRTFRGASSAVGTAAAAPAQRPSMAMDAAG